MIAMNNIDSKIIEKLLDNSRVPFSKVAKELEVSTDTVIRHYKELKKKGVIKPITIINLGNFGYSAGVWYMLSLKPQTNISEIIKKISKIKNIIFVIKAVGTYDLLVIAMVRNFDEMFKVGEELYKDHNISKIEARPYKSERNEEEQEVLLAFLRGFYKPFKLDSNSEE